MANLSLDEIRKVVHETSIAYSDAIRGGQSTQEAEVIRTGRLGDVLRELHLSKLADQLTNEIRNVRGD